MTLKILKKKNIYHLKGKIITSDINSLVSYFTTKINKKNKIFLNINETQEIDKNGLKAIGQLMNLASSKDKRFTIVGFGCKEIYDHFQYAS